MSFSVGTAVHFSLMDDKLNGTVHEVYMNDGKVIGYALKNSLGTIMKDDKGKNRIYDADYVYRGWAGGRRRNRSRRNRSRRN